MIINTVALHNFMSYADAVLDLSSVDVACLSGQNGAGKSALLDAVTWSLWENARSSSDELIKVGEKEMWVDLTFGHEGQRYRVRRTRHKSSSKSGHKGASKGSLELQIFMSDVPVLVAAGTASATNGASNLSGNQSQGIWRSLTSGNMRETQKSICDLLRMDFETFVNSVYLRQGKADEFTTRLPSERKQILGEILGLSYFDRLQEKAREKGRLLRGRAEYLENALLSEVGAEQRHQESLEDLSTWRVELEKTEGLHRSVVSEVEELVSQCQNAMLAQQSAVSNRQQLVELANDIERLAVQYAEFAAKLADIDQLLEQSPQIEASIKAFDSLKIESEELDKCALLVQELNHEKVERQSQLATTRSRLEYELGGAQTSFDEATARAARLTRDTADSASIEAAYESYKELLREDSAMAAQQEAFTKFTRRTSELQTLITETRIHLEAELAQKELKIEEMNSLLSSRSFLLDEKSRLEAETSVLDQLETEFELVEQKGLQLKTTMENCEKQIFELKRQEQETEGKIEELHRHEDSSICPLCSGPIVDRVAVVERYRHSISLMNSQIATLLDKILNLEFDRNILRKRYSELRKRLEDRKSLDVQIGRFNEKLAAIGRVEDQLLSENKERDQLAVRLEQNDYAQLERESLIAIMAELHKLEFDPVLYTNLQVQIKSQRGVESRYNQLRRDKADLARIQIELPDLEKRATQLSNQLASESYGEQVRTELKDVLSRLSGLSYDPKKHNAVKRNLVELLPTTEVFKDLQRALHERPNLEQSARTSAELIARKREQALRIEAETMSAENSGELLIQWQSALKEKEQMRQQLQLTKEELGKKVAVTESILHRLSCDLAKTASQRTELNQCRKQIEEYSILAEAFGKKGIQAAIIENAIPEIECEANRILSRLTENKMHIGILTQHKNKSGAMAETLELMIGDEVGTRSYELFSGGEAFKINFAIRVSLSRLLARRCGARLETLIIDEGFGSQDESSRERLVRAIRSIQPDFARILVITHMADIKEMFPIQIQVNKINGASRLEVLR